MNIRNKSLAILLILIGLMSAGCAGNKEDYRQIQVYKIDGSATVDRQGSSMEAYENMQLLSGDTVETGSNSNLQLLLDQDKYILVEPNSRLSLQATGNSQDSYTHIYLEKGAIVNQLDNPLSQESSYEVTTPNSTMAVRGTTFRVEVDYNDKEESFTKIHVTSGKVEVELVFPDGSKKEPVDLESGEEVLVRGDVAISEYVINRDLPLPEVAPVKEEEEAAIEDAEKEPREDTEEEKQETPKAQTANPPAAGKEIPTPASPKPQENKLPEDTNTQPQTSVPDTSNNNSGSTTPETGGTAGGSTGGTGTGGTGTTDITVTIKFTAQDGSLFATKTIQNTADSTSVSIGGLPVLKPSAAGRWLYNQTEVVENASLQVAAGTTEVTIVWSVN